MTIAALVLGAMLAVAPAGPSAVRVAAPVAPADAQLLFHLPRPADGLPALRQFFDAAGAKAPLLRPAALGKILAPALGADLFDRAALEAAGIDAAHPITLSLWKGQWLACFSPKVSMAAAAAEAAAGLAPLPLPLDALDGGPELRTARFEEQGIDFQGRAGADGSWRSGRAWDGARACAAAGSADQRPLLRRAAQALRGESLGSSASFLSLARGVGSAPLIGFFRTALGDVGARFWPRERSLAVEGRLRGSGDLLAASDRRDASIPRPPRPRGRQVPLWLDLALSPQALAPAGPVDQWLGRAIGALCPDCPAGAQRALQRSLLSSLDGSISFAVTGVDGRQPRGSLHQVRQALFAPLRHPERVQRALDALMAQHPATRLDAREGPGLRVLSGGQPVHVGISGGALYFGNDAELLKRGIAALGDKPRRAPRAAVQIALDGPRLAKLLQGVSMFDMANGDLFAALFVLKMEASALLRSSERLELTANPDGADVRFELAVDLEGSGAPKAARPAAAPKK